MKVFWKYLNMVLFALPLVNGLPGTRLKNHLEAFKEVGATFVISTAPIWLSALMVFATKTISLGSAFCEILDHGELYMYCTSLLAPIFYLVHKETNESKHKKFPGALGHVLLVAVILIICSFAYGFLRANIPIVKMEFLFKASIFLYALSLSLIYLATVYTNGPPRGFAEEINEESAALTEPRVNLLGVNFYGRLNQAA